MLFFMLKLDEGSTKNNALNKEIDENAFYVYCVDNGYSSVKRYKYKDLSDSSITIDEIISCLSKEPADLSCAPAVTKGISIIDYKFGEDGQLIIDFSSEYMNLNNIEEVLTRAAVVKTVCQMQEISYVEFYVDNQPLVLNDGIPVGIMNEKFFIDTSGSISEYDQQLSILVYYGDENGKKLKPVQLIVESIGFKTGEEVVLEQLFKGPAGFRPELRKTVPEETGFNKVKTTDGICFVDLNSSFIEEFTEVNRNIRVYSIVNSLCELQNVNTVKITVNGMPLQSFRNFDFPEMMKALPELISDDKGGD